MGLGTQYGINVKGEISMTRKIKARIKGSFNQAIATVIVDKSGNIEEILDIEDFEDLFDCEVKEEIYQID